MTVAIEQKPETKTEVDITIDPIASERRGRMWLICSFLFCPCHLPILMAALAVVFGGSAFGVLVSKNAIIVGVISTIIYAIGVAIGFKHLRRAAKSKNCDDYECMTESTSFWPKYKLRSQ